MPDVSIIIPAYNRLWSLPDAIASCRQNACSHEIVVVDDGSTDGTWQWLESQPGIVAVHQDNWGKCNAVNRGFELARGEYVRFLDSDDLLPPGANDIELAAARAASADIVVAGKIERSEPDGTERTLPWVPCDDFIAQQLGEQDSSHYSAYLFKRAFIKDIRHRQEFAYIDDRMFVIEAAIARPRVVSVETPCLIHRHHERDRLQFSRGQTALVSRWQTLQAFRKAATMLETRGELTARRKRALTWNLWSLAHRFAATDLGEARQIVRWIKELDPEFVAPDGGVVGAMHRTLGFTLTQSALRVARGGRRLLRKFGRPPGRLARAGHPA
jgi:glycosyltransferase involved in cell wall biosynthesis